MNPNHCHIPSDNYERVSDNQGNTVDLFRYYKADDSKECGYTVNRITVVGTIVADKRTIRTRYEFNSLAPIHLEFGKLTVMGFWNCGNYSVSVHSQE